MSSSRIRSGAFTIALLAWTPAVYAQTSSTSIQVAWTAPGDDGSLGTAAQYDLRYSTSPITATNFSSATRWTATPAPAASGTTQTVTVTGLTPSTTYSVAIKTADDAGNWSVISNVVSRATPASLDVAPPAPVAVSVSAWTDTTAALSWTAPGDDSLAGIASSYDIRYSTAAITASSWASATQVTGEPTPAPAGTAQSYVVRGLSRETTYYFAIRATDDAGNIAALSNVPGGTTPDTMAPSPIVNLSVNFWWLEWCSAGAVTPHRAGGR